MAFLHWFPLQSHPSTDTLTDDCPGSCSLAASSATPTLHILFWSPPLTLLPKDFTQQITSSLWLLQLLAFPGTNTLILLLPHETKESHHIPIPCFIGKLLTESASHLYLYCSPSTQCRRASQAPWELHDPQGNRYPAPALLRTNLLLLDTSAPTLGAPSHLLQVFPSQLPQSNPPAPGSPDSPTYPTQPNSSRPFTAIILYSPILLAFLHCSFMVWH